MRWGPKFWIFRLCFSVGEINYGGRRKFEWVGETIREMRKQGCIKEIKTRKVKLHGNFFLKKELHPIFYIEEIIFTSRQIKTIIQKPWLKRYG
jgi:hypothetical protein